MNKGFRMLVFLVVLLFSASTMAPAIAQQNKPNILVIWGDDIGWFNVSAYNRGMMAYKTPNIDKIANEGILFTDAYGQNSCTAGRSAFITGQSPFRTGLLKGRNGRFQQRCRETGVVPTGAVLKA